MWLNLDKVQNENSSVILDYLAYLKKTKFNTFKTLMKNREPIMGPGSFSLTIILSFQAFIYIHTLNIALFKLITTGLNQMILQILQLPYFKSKLRKINKRRDLHRYILQRAMSTNITRIKIIFNLKQNSL